MRPRAWLRFLFTPAVVARIPFRVSTMNRQRSIDTSLSPVPGFLEGVEPCPIEDIAVDYMLHRRQDYLPSTSVSTDLNDRMVKWYRINRRKLPWRGDPIIDSDTDSDVIALALGAPVTPSAYGVWVSEVMLQQTRVETVIQYWMRWMRRFPTVHSLSIATPDEVNQMWAGLGYYRRAQQLLLGAKKVVEDFDGVVPQSRDALLTIPGIGAYTAGAISSIAYGKNEPLVDGNVIRVLSRLFSISFPLPSSALDKRCWAIAGKLVEGAEFPGDFNQALMELGATICKPTSPACDICPVNTLCNARRLVRLSDQISPRLNGFIGQSPQRAEQKSNTEVSCGSGVERVAKENADEDKDHMRAEAQLQLILSEREKSVIKNGRRNEAPTSAVSYRMTDLGRFGSPGLPFDLRCLPINVCDFPVKTAKKRAREVLLSVCVLRCKNFSLSDSPRAKQCPSMDQVKVGADPEANGTDNVRYLFLRRPAKGLLANQWEFPSAILFDEANRKQSCSSTAQLTIEEKDLSITADDLSTGKHTVTEEQLFSPFPKLFLRRVFAQYCNGSCNLGNETSFSSSTVLMTLTELAPPPSSRPYSKRIEDEKDVSSTSDSEFIDCLRESFIEPIVHVFSHQRHTMHVIVRDVSVQYHTNSPSKSHGRGDVNEARQNGTSGEIHEANAYEIDGGGQLAKSREFVPIFEQEVDWGEGGMRWMTAEEIVQAGITTGCKKVLAKVRSLTAVSDCQPRSNTSSSAALKNKKSFKKNPIAKSTGANMRITDKAKGVHSNLSDEHTESTSKNEKLGGQVVAVEPSASMTTTMEELRQLIATEQKEMQELEHAQNKTESKRGHKRPANGLITRKVKQVPKMQSKISSFFTCSEALEQSVRKVEKSKE